MQTFLPFADFDECARVLDPQRLNKQLVEVQQVVISLTEERGWLHHPAVKMWRGHTGTLWEYALAMAAEIAKRKGHASVGLLRHKSWDFISDRHGLFDHDGDEPWWLGHEALHANHRGNLLRKHPEHYARFFPTDRPVEGYLWPLPTGEFRDMRKA